MTSSRGRLTSYFPAFDMVELDGGQRANSPELMVHRAVTYSLHICLPGEVRPVGGGFGRSGGCGCSWISTALDIQAGQRRFANPLSPTL